MTIPYPIGNPLRGTIAKGTEYLTTLQSLTTDPSHPRHQGVAMQAHHVISAKAISMGSYNDRLEDFGYNINAANNLVFIPSTLQGACLLQVQPHRGNHTASDPPDIDSNRDPSYHERVLRQLRGVMPKLERECGKPGIDMKIFTHSKLGALSRMFIRLIQNKPTEAKLTKLWANFQPGNMQGCGGVRGSVNDKPKSVCPVDRDHTGKRGPGQPDEGITYVCTSPYQLKAGN